MLFYVLNGTNCLLCMGTRHLPSRLKHINPPSVPENCEVSLWKLPRNKPNRHSCKDIHVLTSALSWAEKVLTTHLKQGGLRLGRGFVDQSITLKRILGHRHKLSNSRLSVSSRFFFGRSHSVVKNPAEWRGPIQSCSLPLFVLPIDVQSCYTCARLGQCVPMTSGIWNF